ncbi:iron chelate uptake ABC transporter family permease subunit, partial [Escherichia coli]
VSGLPDGDATMTIGPLSFVGLMAPHICADGWLFLLAITPLCRRWLTILPLGGDTARAVGDGADADANCAAAVSGLPDGDATMTIGPLSFVGLMAPHICADGWL